MHTDALMVLDAPGSRRSNFEMGVEAVRHQGNFFVANDVTSRDVGAVGTGQIHRYALSPTGDVDRFAMNLQTANAEQMVSGQTAHLFANFDFTAQGRTGDDDAVSLEDEGAINRKAE